MSITFHWQQKCFSPANVISPFIVLSHSTLLKTSVKSVRFLSLKGQDIGAGLQGASMRRLSSLRMETRRTPWVGRCTRGAGRHRCHQSWRCSARIWSQALCRAGKYEGEDKCENTVIYLV